MRRENLVYTNSSELQQHNGERSHVLRAVNFQNDLPPLLGQMGTAREPSNLDMQCLYSLLSI
jgi:hypothetical protein